ncbi:hypothetical protein [Desertivirga arenae]|uniref:hypothetical protein n=1 Tax=Desertivirga arenae TaxID=2810309 RepID=UPI001A962ECC|nr:hypothetical protein [Pedobacter sp. SYSU D00823]
MKLKPAGIFIIIAIIAVLGYFAFKNSGGSNKTETSDGATNSWDSSASGNQSQAQDNNKTSSDEAREFSYTPEKPQNGTLNGVVELGATGFNSFVINLDKEKRWEIVSKDFGESLAYEGLATTEDIRGGLKKYIAGMFDKGVAKNNVHFVISSGAQKEAKTKTISNELKKMGFVVNNVTPDQEAKFALQATVPPAFIDNSFMVDIGSGNTKISWEENGALKSQELPGAKYFQQNLSDQDVYNQVKEAVAKVPSDKRNVGFIIGGVPFTLAKQHRKGEERYTVLKSPGSYNGEDKKMQAGLNIYKAIADATKTDTFVFDWDANFTIGFLLSLKK